MSDRQLVRQVLYRVPEARNSDLILIAEVRLVNPEARELNIVRYRQFYQARGEWLPTNPTISRRRRRHARYKGRFHDC